LVRRGLTEGDVNEALGDLDVADLPPATVAALRLADRLTEPRPAMDERLRAELAEHYDDGQVLELGAALSIGSGWQRFIEAFEVRPDQWTEATPLPWQAERADG
jgi:alkylhydroperoxidase family enzyme